MVGCLALGTLTHSLVGSRDRRTQGMEALLIKQDDKYPLRIALSQMVDAFVYDQQSDQGYMRVSYSLYKKTNLHICIP